MVSSILGATSNWLVLRSLYSALSTSNQNAFLGQDESQNDSRKKVVLVSFLRGWEFWRAEAKRLVSIRSFLYWNLGVVFIYMCNHVEMFYIELG